MTDSKALVPAPGSDVVVASLTNDQIEVVRSTICSGYTDTEMRLYLYQCEKLDLDPLARETYTFKAGGKVIIGVSIDGFRKRANDTGCYMPGSPTEYEFDKHGTLESARVFVKRLANGEWHEFSEDAFFSEFKGSQPIWKTMPRVMLSKCAEARALRRAFPRELGGLYAPEERNSIERNNQPQTSTAATRATDNFKRDAVNTAAEPVDETPDPVGPHPTWSPRAKVHWWMKHLGATGEDVTASAKLVNASANPNEWTDEDVEAIREMLATPSTHYTAAMKAVETMAAREKDVRRAMEELNLDGIPPANWTAENENEFLFKLEEQTGV
ncbi:MAG: recombinase RecT [Dehalococcoidales bacterium]